LEEGIQPDFFVGTSAGALNAAFMAIDPAVEQARRLSVIWGEAKSERIGLGNSLTIVRRMIQRKPSFFESKPLAHFIQSHLPPGITLFSELKAPAYTVATRFPDGQLRIFGDNPQDKIIDGMMASSAIPPYFPPWDCDGQLFVDGGTLSKFPLLTALERGASEIYGLDIEEKTGNSPSSPEKLRLMSVAWGTISLILAQQVKRELEEVKARGASLHLISLRPGEIPFWDFEHGKELVDLGKAQAQEVFHSI